MLFYGFSHLKDFAFTIRSFKWISPARRKPKISNWTGSSFDVFSPCWAGKPSAGTSCIQNWARVGFSSFVAGIRIIDDESCIFRMFQVLWQMFIFVLSSRLCKNDSSFCLVMADGLDLHLRSHVLEWLLPRLRTTKAIPQNLKIKCSDDFLQLLLVVD